MLLMQRLYKHGKERLKAVLGFAVVAILQNVTGLTIKRFADRLKCRKTDGACLVVFKNRQIRKG